MKEGYKMSELGAIPETWDASDANHLGIEFIDGDRGINYPKTHDFIEKGFCLFLSTKNVTKNGFIFENCQFITSEKDSQLRKGKLSVWDFVITTRGSIGNVALYDSSVAFKHIRLNSGMVILRDGKSLFDKKYLYQYLKSPLFQKQVDTISSGSAQPQLTIKELKKTKLLRPPFQEQQKIATILSTVDEKIEIIDAQITQTRELKKGLMQKLLTRGIGHTKFQDSVLGEIPESWKVIKLGELVSKVGSGITPKGGQESYLSEGVIFIRSQNVLVNKLKLTDVAYISPYQHNKMSNSKIQPMDVLLNITGASIGRCCLVPSYIEEANVNQHVCVIRVNEKLNPVYLAQVLNSNFGSKQIDKFQAGGNREGLNFQQIRSFDIILPNIAEQQQVATILTAIDDKIDVLQTKKEGYQELKKGLMQQLLTGKVRVFQSELETA